VSTAAALATGATPLFLLGVNVGAPPASSNVSLLQAALDALASRGKRKAPPPALSVGFCVLLLMNAVTCSHLESAYREDRLGAHEFAAFLTHEIPRALL
jgi:hypothetical protein